MEINCERCETDGARTFQHYDTGVKEKLCWPCRKPMVLERARQGTPSKDTSSVPDPPESEPKDGVANSGQTGISDFL